MDSFLWDDAQFVFEEMIAQKVIFSRQSLLTRAKLAWRKLRNMKIPSLGAKASELVPSLREIAVWVSSPAGDDLLVDRNVASGTFLYLIESYWRADAQHELSCEFHRGATSGLSALSIILDELAGLDIVSRSSTNQFRNLFRRNTSHPIEVFKALGAKVQPERRIRSLYRKRYVSDILYFKDSNGVRHHCCDVFAYPIFIEAV